MKISAKKIGKMLSIIWNGKPKEIVAQDNEEMNHYVDLIKKTHNGDKKAQNELESKIFKKEELIIDEKINSLKKDFVEISGKIKEVEIEKQYDNIKRQSEIFEIKNINNREAVFLKGFKAELPQIIVDKFIDLLSHNKDITNLVDFWKLNLMNHNAEARRGLYKFITKQKLFIVEGGYFIAFRRIVSAKTENYYQGNSFDAQIIKFADKIKKAKKGKRNFEVYKNKSNAGDTYILTPIKNHEKNQKDVNLEFMGVFHDVFEAYKLRINDNIVENTNKIYTDNHTRTMIIKIGEPVRMNRAKCNTNSKVECSYGLHVGSQNYVGRNQSLGDTIVACLVNPQHVISVPYSDAHKMRVCEYFPFMTLTNDELLNFENIDISKYINQYKKIEAKKLEESLNVIDTLNQSEFKEFSITRKITSQADLDKLINDFKNKKAEINAEEKKISQILDDDISTSLDINEIKAIIKSRLN